jgi:diadenosine tetraphosphate (Ap4A) HIT family hydrolase
MEAPMPGCIFCEIVAGRAPANFVYRDERCVAFMDIQPITPGHLLVVPVQHAASLAELDLGAGEHVFQVAQRMAAALRRSGIRCEGIDLFLADGAVAGQTVFHVHMHVIPRFAGDGFGLRFPPGYGRRPAGAELDAQAAQIAAQL